jgi:hypothetical protein
VLNPNSRSRCNSLTLFAPGFRSRIACCRGLLQNTIYGEDQNEDQSEDQN